MMKWRSVILGLIVVAVFICSQPAAASTSRALLSSELATASTYATGTGSSVGQGSNLQITSSGNSGATNTGDVKEAISNAESFLFVDAEDSSTESESFADTLVDEPVDEIPYDTGSVSSGGVASGIDYAGTNAHAYVSVIEAYEGLEESSAGQTVAGGSSGAGAVGAGSATHSFVDAEGESRTVGSEGEMYAMADSSASGYTEASGHGEESAWTISNLDLLTSAQVNPVMFAADTSVAVIDAWSEGYGDSHSETMTNTMLQAGAGFSKDVANYLDLVGGDAEAGALAVFNTQSSASGPGLTASGGNGETESRSIADAMVLLDGPTAIGSGVSEGQAFGRGQVYAGGENTDTAGSFYAFTFADSDADAKRFGQFSFSSDLGGMDNTLSEAATSMVVATGMGSGADSSVIDFFGRAASFSDERASIDGESRVRNSAAAEGQVTTVADYTKNEVTGSGTATAYTGAYSNIEDAGTVGIADSSGYGQATSTSTGGNLKMADNYVSVGAVGNADTVSKLDGVVSTGIASGRGFARGVGEFAEVSTNYGSLAESLATAETAGKVDVLIEGVAPAGTSSGVSATATEGYISNMNSIMANNIDLYVAKLDPAAPTVVSGQSAVVSTSEAEAFVPDYSTGLTPKTFGATSSSTTGGNILLPGQMIASFAIGEGFDVMGSGSLVTATTSETIAGAGAGGQNSDDSIIEFASTLGYAVGMGSADMETTSYDYLAKGGDVGEVEVLMSGGSAAGSTVETAAIATDYDEEGFFGSFKGALGYTMGLIAEGFGSGSGSVEIDYSPGSSFEAENTIEILGDGEANVGGGATSLVNDGIGSRYGLAAGDSSGEGQGVGEGFISTKNSFYDNPGEVILEGVASGEGSATSLGASSTIVSDFVIDTNQEAAGTADGSSSVDVYSQGGASNLVAESFSSGLTEGAAAIGEMAPSLGSNAVAGAYESGTSLMTEAAAMQSAQNANARARTDSASDAEGFILLNAQPGDVLVELNPELNYATSGGNAFGFTGGNDGTSEVAGMTESLSMSIILSPGDETKYVQITMDGDNEILTGGYAGGESLGFGYTDQGAAAITSPIYPGFTSAEAESFALGLAAGTTTAFGVASASQDPSLEMDTIGGAFNGAYGKGVSYADASAQAIYMEDNGLASMFTTDVADSFSGTPNVGFAVGYAGEFQILSADANAEAASEAIAGEGDIISLSEAAVATDAYGQVGMESVAGVFIDDDFQYIGDAMALEDESSGAAAGAAIING